MKPSAARTLMLLAAVALGGVAAYQRFSPRIALDRLARGGAAFFVHDTPGDRKAVLAADGSVALLERGEREEVWLREGGPASALGAFSPDGKRLALLCGGDAIEVWDVEKRQLASRLAVEPPVGDVRPGLGVFGFVDAVTLVLVSPGGRSQAWDVAAGVRLVPVGAPAAAGR